MDVQPGPPTLRLERWTTADLALLQQINEPEMMAHLGGPETEERVVARLEKYVARGPVGSGDMFKIVLPDGQAVGSVGYWERAWADQAVYETGWHVLRAFQGRGIAVEATRMVAQRASAERSHRYLHAYPGVTNAASNAICRKVGFELLGEHDFEYPPGHAMRCNDWRLDLMAWGPG
jgi:RimJ/RimL family protein N-acetyltransferase